MKKADIPGIFPKSTLPPTTTPTSDDTWKGLTYRPNPDCPVCRGAGFLHPRGERAIDYSRAIPCLERGCLQSSIRGNVIEEVARQNFETFVPVPGSEKVLKAAQELAAGTAGFVWLLIFGRPGNGKTHICNAIARRVRDRGIDIRMILAADLFANLREAISTHQTDYLLRRHKEITFLIIDDYGVEYGTDWEQAKFDELMTSRYSLDKPTVVTTNKDVTGLPERIQSRFKDVDKSRAIHNSAADYRRRR